MKILVCGGRDFEDEGLMGYILDGYQPIDEVIHGMARGADRMGGAYAEVRGIPVRQFPADWERDGRGAGAIRNTRMLKEGQPDIVVAFPGGRGTQNMINQAIKAGVKVDIVHIS